MERSLPYLAPLLLIAYASLGQEVLVRTEARMVTGQPVQSAIRFLDLSAETVWPNASILPGAVVTGPGLPIPGGILFSSGGAPHAPLSDGIPERSYVAVGPLGVWSRHVSPFFETEPETSRTPRRFSRQRAL